LSCENHTAELPHCLSCGTENKPTALQEKAAVIRDTIAALSNISEQIKNTTEKCSLENLYSPMEYFDFVTTHFFFPLIKLDILDDDNIKTLLWDRDTDLMTLFATYHSEGIACLKGSNQIDMLVIQTVIDVYIKMHHLKLDSMEKCICNGTTKDPHSLLSTLPWKLGPTLTPLTKGSTPFKLGFHTTERMP